MRTQAWKAYLTKAERQEVRKLEQEIKRMQKQRRAIMFKMIDRARRLHGRISMVG